MRQSTVACTFMAWLLAAGSVAGEPGPTVPGRDDGIGGRRIVSPAPEALGGGIQIAINASNDGDVIEIPPGVYEEPIDFGGRLITLRATDGPFSTTIDATGFAVTAVTMSLPAGADGLGLVQRLEGFRITGGSGGFGGGVAVFGAGAAVIADCIVEDNIANFGGGLFIDDESTVEVVNTMIIDNEATGFGSAVFSNRSDPSFANCTVTGNTAPAAGGVMFSVASLIGVTNSIIHGNLPSSILGVSLQIRNSDVEGGWPGVGNINANPLFTDVAAGDYRPSFFSPCVDRGSNDDVPSGFAFDVRGNPRIVASDGDSEVVDMGAIEYQGVEPGDPLPPIITGVPAGSTIILAPGDYQGPIDFQGRAITIKSRGGPGATRIVPPSGGAGPLVLFTTSEGINSVLDGFTLEGALAVTRGGAVLIEGAEPTIINCIFRGNEALEAGGAIAILDGAPDIIDCVFLENRIFAKGDGGLFGGGAIVSENSAPRIVNCTFLDNDGVEQGGAMLSDSASAPFIANSILWNNSPDQVAGGNVTISYSDVQGGKGGGEGNIDVDPRIVDAFRLDAGSPCIDAADATVFPSNLFTDILGQPRFFDDPFTSDSGKGAPPIDMGATEFQGPPPCTADIDGDGNVGFAEILAVLGAWGPCDGCPEDVDEDGQVGFSDVLAILGAWGPCPGRIGACCLAFEGCMQATPETCAQMAGDFVGFDDCATADCGACCTGPDECGHGSRSGCEGGGGVYLGDGSSCDQDGVGPCAVGACCIPFDGCSEEDEGACESLGGTFFGFGTRCLDVQCPLGACCFIDDGVPFCEDNYSQFICEKSGGVYQGDGADCEDVVCPEATGACCLSDGICIDDVTFDDCQNADGDYRGDGSMCETEKCPPP